ncbi:hypothetical protein [Paraburkholderia sp. 22B1P]|uniref:hypothetical protein n=1 Tax=Paraburkholderia sp. 22B1P TaxID=3080498 RepID=UPI00308C260F|nr:hypothetical protein PBP221_17330 [Paraburkholderia sp. 22B1P]
MTAFFFTILVLLAFDVIGRIMWLGTGRIPARTALDVSLDLFINVAMLVWAAYVWHGGLPQ